MFPEGNFTKGEMIRYYIEAAPVLVPHFRDRPVTFIRMPDGVTGEKFYEKNAPAHTPDWVKTTHVPKAEGGHINYILVNDAHTAAWCANNGAIEFHPFLHRADDLKRPTHIAFDLDPGDGADLSNCIEVGFLVRDLLAKVGLEAYPKVSGSKGLQLYVPLNTAVTYEQTTPFARSVADLLHARHPDLVVADMSKALRVRRVLIDWSQNNEKKTTVGAYSLRGKRNEPFVSTPVEWIELKRVAKSGDLDALFFPPAEVIRRIRKRGDLFAPVLKQRQKLPPPFPPESEAETARIQAKRAKVRQKTDKESARRGPPEPKFVEPMTAREVEELPDSPEWLYEIKLDGYRGFGVKHGTHTRLLSRKSKNLGADFPGVLNALGTIHAGTAMLDGEIVALDRDGKPSFQLLQNRKSSASAIVYYAFDLLSLDGEDWRDRPLEARKAKLAEIVRGSDVRLMASLDGPADRVVAGVEEMEFEGVIAKRRGSTYQSGERSGDWLKFKLSPEQEFVIGGYRRGSPLESLVVGYFEAGKLLCAGKVRQGLGPRNRRELHKLLQPLQADVCPFANLPSSRKSHWGEGITAEQMKEIQWVMPKVVAQVSFTEWTAAGNLRHATFKALRHDKEPDQVVRES